MAQKLRKSALMFGQVAQPEPPKPTLSSFYGGVGAGQVGAVEKVGEGVRTETSKLPGVFGGVTETKDEAGKTTGYALGAGEAATPFKATVARTPTDLKTTGSLDVTATVDDKGNITYKDKAGNVVQGPTAAQVGDWTSNAAANVSALQTAGAKEEAALQEASTKASEKAGETLKQQQDRLTKGKLGERREASELEKQAQDYRNILTTTPGTTNIAAVKNLMQFYDMKKYGSLESGLRQGEIALARQEAGSTEAGLQTAEGARTGAIEGFKEATQENYDKLTKAIEQDKQNKLKAIKDYYSSEIGKQQSTAETAKAKADELAGVERKAEAKKAEVADQERVGIENSIYGDPLSPDPEKSGGVLPTLTKRIRDELQFAKDRLENLNKTPRLFRQKGHTKEVQSHELIVNKAEPILKILEALDREATKARINKDVPAMKKHLAEINELKKQYDDIRRQYVQLASQA